MSSEGTGIAGAMDYQPAPKKGANPWTCSVCGVEHFDAHTMAAGKGYIYNECKSCHDNLRQTKGV